MILITGGAGYIGSHMNKYLAQRKYKTIVLDNLTEGNKIAVKWGEFIKGDLSDKKLLDVIFKKNKIDAVFHFAASADVADSMVNPSKYYGNNVSNTINLLDALVANKVRNFVFSSTAAVFGTPKKMPINEKAEKSPINPYGSSKLMAEKIIQDYAVSYGLKYVIFRYFCAAGADKDCEIGEMHHPENHLIPLILDAAIGIRDSIKIFGTKYKTKDGTCIRDFIHVSDLAQAHMLALNYLKKGGKSDAFNLGLGRGSSVRETIAVGKKVTGVDFKVIESGIRAGDPAELIASGDKARNILGWKPEFITLESIMKTAWEWHKKYKKRL